MLIYIFIAVAIIELIIIFIFLKNNTKKKSQTISTEIKFDDLIKKLKKMRTELSRIGGHNEFLSAKINALDEKIKLLEEANIQLLKKKEELTATKQKLEALQKRKDEVFATAVHDIKNPASAIHGYLELLESYDLTASEQQEIIQNMLQSAEQIFKLTKEITEVVANENPEPVLKREMTSIKNIIDAVCSQNTVYAESKKIKLVNKSSINIPDVNIDAGKIEEVIDNLINNAIKYGPENSSVFVNTFFTNNKLTVEVSDDGVGLSKEDIEKAFKKGSKLSPKPTGSESSSGLGLWIVKRIIEEHNGSVFLKSKLGVGSTFSFDLPLVKQRPQD